MHYLRTPEGQKKYDEYRAHKKDDSCALCTASPLKTFQYWKVITNLFPYDRIAKVHHMVVPLRHVTEESLDEEEINEYMRIKNEYLFDEYECIIEACASTKSIPEHHHLHLIITKES